MWATGQTDMVTDVLERAIAVNPTKPFLDFSGDVYTYEQFGALSDQLAAGLIALGVEPGDTVVSMLDNNLEAVLSWFAINKIGGISVPVNTALRGRFLSHQIRDSGAALVIAEPDYAKRIADLQDRLPDLRRLIVRGDIDVSANGVTVSPFSDIMIDATGFKPHPIKPDDLSMLIYTSGTTGPSKGCMISHNYACNLARQSIHVTRCTADDIIWTPLPLFHLNATVTNVLRAAMLGATCAVYPRFSVSHFWGEIERSKASMISLLGSMPFLIANAPASDQMVRCFGQLSTISTVPFPPSLRNVWTNRFGVKKAASGLYGLSEAALVTYSTVDDDVPHNSSGRRNDDFDVMVVDDDGQEVAPGQSGEILIRPKKPNIMFEGYWNRPAETLKTLKDLWFHSGDIGMFDDDGFFYFVDRKKDYLRRRGENISSLEMEGTFSEHPDIKDVAVHAVFSPLSEDDVKVTAVLNEGSQLAPEDLCLWCLEKVPYYAVPRYIEFRKDLPRNATGKVLKYQLREEGCTPTTWDREKSDVKVEKR